MATGAPPTTELGALGHTGLAGWKYLVDDVEDVPQLIWPQNLPVYREMKRDAQVEALYRGITHPVRRYDWSVDPNGAPMDRVEKIAYDLNLPIKGQEPGPKGRRKRRFSFPMHLKWVLESILWGHYFFEQVGEVGDDGLWHLRKLAPRPPRSIEDIDTEPDGGLKSIKVPAARSGSYSSVDIPVSRLVAYVWDQEPGYWTGQSMLRGIYKNWLLKDRLVRIDLIKHDRAGGGIPTATAPPGASKQQIQELDRMARSMRVDEEGGGAAPHGTDFKLMGITGTVPDTWDSIRGHNEEMARSWMSQVLQLGQTQTGSRALGEVHLQILREAQDMLADWVVDTFNEHVIEDIVDWNWGDNEAAPLLSYERPEDDRLAVADLKQMVDSGMIQVDEELEVWLRQIYRMPERGTKTSTVDVAAKKADRRSSRLVAAEEHPLPRLPSRELRREPFDHEIRAAVDFEALDTAFIGLSGELREDLLVAQSAQIDELIDAIRSSGNDLDVLSAIESQTLPSEEVETVLRKAITQGETGAKGEAVAQGVSKPVEVVLDDIEIREWAEAVAEQLSRGLSTVASREAVRRSGTLSPEELGESVRSFLNELSPASVEKQSRGVVSRGINIGRTSFGEVNIPTAIYASELLDENTCEKCAEIDGKEFATVEEARKAYPSGYIECEGGDNCRGTLVFVYDEVEPTLEGS